MKKKLMSMILVLMMVVGLFPGSIYADDADSVESIYKATGDYLEAQSKVYVPTVNSIGGEWLVLGMVRSGREVPDGYYANVAAHVEEEINEKERLHWYKSTDNSRVILALTAAGYDVTNIKCHNLLEGLNEMKYVSQQGINGPVWALIALDSYGYEIPAIPAAEDPVTREKLIQKILDAQLTDGGWTLSGKTSDPDMTGMAMQALAPYYESDSEVKAAVDQALNCLSKLQNADGTYSTYNTDTSESAAQVVVALASLGINPDTDERFIKNGVSVLDALCSYAVAGGGFKHVSSGKIDGMATEQAYYALTAYFRYLDGKTNLYDMSDVTLIEEAGPCPVKSFIDLSINDWYHEAVEYMLENGMMKGMGGDKFAPDVALTRAMFVTMLWRIEGSPEVTYEMTFEDAGTDSWYTEPIRWSASEGIVKGFSDKEFRPDAEITREQMATILYRYAEYKDQDVSGGKDVTLSFNDTSEISDWAKDAIKWAYGEGVVAGQGNNTLNPKGLALRSHAAQMLMNFLEK